MKASQTLPRPGNWQDFETLCKKLWGEIWNCPEILMNGRLGQSQSGIDIYGIPDGQNSYYGIQCKGLNENLHTQITEKEIIKEIEKAKKFEPSLKKMYFATTAPRDVTIQTFVRKKNIENINQGLFEVHLYSWEDIVELIFENKNTYDYYLNSNSFKTSKSVKVTFKNGLSEMTVNPKFKKVILVPNSQYEKLKNQAQESIDPIVKGMLSRQWINSQIFDSGDYFSSNKAEINRSFIDITVTINNNGSEALEHWKLIMYLPKNIQDVTHKIIKKDYPIISRTNVVFDTYIDSENKTVEIEPRKKILVGDDSFSSDPIFIKPNAEEHTLEIHWKLMSSSHKQEGLLILNVKPDIHVERLEVDADSEMLLNENSREVIKDYIETIED